MGIDLRRAVFLDRDGVINAEIFYTDTQSYESPRAPEEFFLLPGVAEVMLRLQQADFLLFVVSNQPNHAKGKTSLEQLATIHTRMEMFLQEAGITLTESFYCYHHPDGITPGYNGLCRCRKPSPHFLLEAQQKYQLDMSRSWMIGDRETDIECGKRAGVQTIRIGKPQQEEPDFTAASLPDALSIMLSFQRG